jgi:hypothetical protein
MVIIMKNKDLMVEIINDPKNIKDLSKKEQVLFIKDSLSVFSYNSMEDWFIDLFINCKVRGNKDLLHHIQLMYPEYFNDLYQKGAI